MDMTTNIGTYIFTIFYWHHETLSTICHNLNDSWEWVNVALSELAPRRTYVTPLYRTVAGLLQQKGKARNCVAADLKLLSIPSRAVDTSTSHSTNSNFSSAAYWSLYHWRYIVYEVRTASLNNELECVCVWKEAVVVQCKVYPSIYLERLRKTKKHPSHDRSPGRDLNPGLHGFGAGVTAEFRTCFKICPAFWWQDKYWSTFFLCIYD
jgi:hypothetical protein